MESVWNPVSEVKAVEEVVNEEKRSASFVGVELSEKNAKSLNAGSGAVMLSLVRKFQLKDSRFPAFAVNVCLMADPSSTRPVEMLLS